MTRLADVVTRTIRSISPNAVSERLFKDPLARWWRVYQQKLEQSGYDGAVQSAFFISTFATMGRVAKSDGSIKDVEVKLAVQIMQRLKLSKIQKQLAIRLFNDGKHEDFALDALLLNFKRECGHRMSVVQAFLEIQFKMAYADASFNEKEVKVIKHICRRLDISDAMYIRIERHVRAEIKVACQPLSASSEISISHTDAHKILGLNKRASQEQIKTAYRRMMSKFHPDKMVSRGASEVEIMEAYDIVYDIKCAYEMLAKLKRA